MSFPSSSSSNRTCCECRCEIENWETGTPELAPALREMEIGGWWKRWMGMVVWKWWIGNGGLETVDLNGAKGKYRE